MKLIQTERYIEIKNFAYLFSMTKLTKVNWEEIKKALPIYFKEAEERELFLKTLYAPYDADLIEEYNHTKNATYLANKFGLERESIMPKILEFATQNTAELIKSGKIMPPRVQKLVDKEDLLVKQFFYGKIVDTEDLAVEHFFQEESVKKEEVAVKKKLNMKTNKRY